MSTVTLEQALSQIEELQKENKRLTNRINFLEEVMYEDTMGDYDDYEIDDYDPRFD